MAQKIYTKDEILDQYKKLPQALKDSMFSVEIAEKIFEIGKKHGLNIEQIGFLGQETGYVTLGFTRPRDYVAALKDRITVDLETIKKIAADINQEIFFPIREAFKQAHSEELSFETLQNTEPLIRRPVTLNSMLGIAPDQDEKSASMDRSIPLQPAAPNPAALPASPQGQGMTPSRHLNAEETSLKPSVPPAPAKIQMNPNLPPPRPSSAEQLSSKHSTVKTELLRPESPPATPPPSPGFSNDEARARDVASHAFFSPKQTSTEGRLPAERLPTSQPNPYQEPIEVTKSERSPGNISEIPEINKPAGNTPLNRTAIPRGGTPELGTEEPQPIPDPAPSSSPQPQKIGSALPKAPLQSMRPAPSFIKPVAPPRPIPAPQQTKIPPIDLRDTKKTVTPPPSLTEQISPKSASAINLKDFPPPPAGQPNLPQALSSTPAVNPMSSAKSIPPSPVSPSHLAGGNSQTTPRSQPMDGLSVDVLRPAIPPANKTEEASPANVRRIEEEQKEIAKTSAPPVFQPQDKDPYREAVD